MASILYISEDTRPLSMEQGNIVWHAREVKEALAMYIYYMPDVIILDGRSVVARLAFEHLSDVTQGSARGIEAALVINAGQTQWDLLPATVQQQTAGTPADFTPLLAALLHEREVALLAEHAF